MVVAVGTPADPRADTDIIANTTCGSSSLVAAQAVAGARVSQKSGAPALAFASLPEYAP
jgi:hypothetical protein